MPVTEVSAPEEVVLPELATESYVLVDSGVAVPLEGSVGTVTTVAADEVLVPKVRLPEIGKTPDVDVPSEVPVLPEGVAVTVTTDAPEDVPEERRVPE